MVGVPVLTVLISCLGILSANAATVKPKVTVTPNIKEGQVDSSVKCPNGFVRYEESCYSFHSEAFSWPEALVFCSTFKNTLVTLRSTAQYEFLQGILATITGGFTAAGFWTAGTAADLPGEWKWATNNRDIEFDTFNATDPNKATLGFPTKQRSGCLALAKAVGFRVSRMDCKTPLHFVCERLDPY
ncbi:lithostathine-like isoform X2 [Saccostrea echinata]|uniref:lithostathine-like isoform X2 n=1 Tax=Saccostrea echinata TaxID=191078 RepID=UPI002A7EEC2F|nr:lithostathine-like isoform X2 [Saccostrea echinata]